MDVRTCIRCFQPLKGALMCPHCGFNNAAYRPEAYILPPGTLLHGQYRLGMALGEGGFGITYVGIDVTLGLKVAVKEYFPANCVQRDASVSASVTCNPSKTQQQIFRLGKEKALQEAQSLAALNDVGAVVRVLSFFEENNTAYIIMEYVKGETLRSYAGRLPGLMTARDAVTLLLPIMRALETVHSRNFVHRDISPDNIMITPEGEVRLLDFGAVKAVTSTEGDATEHPIVKRGYSPMELYSVEGLIGPWSDVYAMCATVYFLVTGKRLAEPMNRQLDDSETVASLAGKTGKKLRTVLLLGLAIDPKKRFQTMSALGNALETALAADGDTVDWDKDVAGPDEDDEAIDDGKTERVKDDGKTEPADDEQMKPPPDSELYENDEKTVLEEEETKRKQEEEKRRKQAEEARRKREEAQEKKKPKEKKPEQRGGSKKPKSPLGQQGSSLNRPTGHWEKYKNSYIVTFIFLGVLALLLLAAAVAINNKNKSAGNISSDLSRQIESNSIVREALGDDWDILKDSIKYFTGEVGGYLQFGEYEQNNDLSDGKEKILWRIVRKEEGRMLIVSRRALARMPFNEEEADVTWEACSLRKWLNADFLEEAFTSEEQSRILSVTVTAEANPFYDTAAGDDAEDRVFLLSVNEANNYLNSPEDRQCMPTATVKAQGTDTEYCDWWLRSPGWKASNAALVEKDGSVAPNGFRVDLGYIGVRPAMWIEIES